MNNTDSHKGGLKALSSSNDAGYEIKLIGNTPDILFTYFLAIRERRVTEIIWEGVDSYDEKHLQDFMALLREASRRGGLMRVSITPSSENHRCYFHCTFELKAEADYPKGFWKILEKWFLQGDVHPPSPI